MTLSHLRVRQNACNTLSEAPDNLLFLDLEPAQIDAQDSVLDWFNGKIPSPPARLLYDQKGALLFEAICATPEYYLTRYEQMLLPLIPEAILPHMDAVAQIVEYGSGNNDKVSRLLTALPQLKAHVPIDISKEHLIENAAELACKHPDRQFTAICADFFQDFDVPARPRGIPITQNIGFFPGSTIGNMPPRDAIRLLSNARRALGDNCLFILAVDRVKDSEILEHAYCDSEGYSAQFSLNLIDRINAQMSGTLQKSAFTYGAHYNAHTQAIEMRWHVTRSHNALVGGEALQFEAGQSFLVEISRKFTPTSVADLASQAGFHLVDILSDPEEWYSLVILKG